MGIKIKNLQTGEFEKFNIPALKGEKGEPGEIEPSEKVDYIGKQHSKLRDTMNTNVDYIIKTAIGEFNYLDYEGQHITATNSIEGHAKSATLKGQTLVNTTLKEHYIALGGRVSTAEVDAVFKTTASHTKSTATVTGAGQYNAFISLRISGSLLKPNTSYFVRIGEYTNTKGLTIINAKIKEQANVISTYTKLAENTFKVTTNSSYTTGSTYGIVFECSNWNQTYEVGDSWSASNIVVVEYIEGMENWDIPYFEGMQSVKMPVLKTVGKNLFDSSDSTMKSSWWIITEGGSTNVKKEELPTNYSVIIPATSDSQYTVSGGNITRNFYAFLDEQYNVLHANVMIDGTTKATSPQGTAYALFYLNHENIENVTNLQIEEGSTATTFEPYKSNILTVNEPIELRGIGDVKDTLDLTTGELTQRIGEVDFTKDWQSINYQDDDFISLYKLDKIFTSKQNAVCDKLPIETWGNLEGNKKECVWVHGSTSWGVILSKTKATNREEIIEWVSQNLEINYKLATPIVKTVDLSDNHVYSYKDVTHYDCSSAEGSLVPTLSVKVPTDTQLTIQEQKATTQTLLIKNMDLQQSIKEVQAMNLAFNTALYNSFNSIREEVEDIKKHISTNENLEGSF